MSVKILTVRDIGRHARSGRPLPYPRPLPADLRDEHIRAARWYFRLFCTSVWLAFVGLCGTLLVRWLPQLLPVFLAAIVVGIVASVGLWTRGVSRHRAVLAAYGVKTDETGKPVLTRSQIAARDRQQVERLDLRTEASRALRWYWVISAVGLATTLGWAAYMARDADVFDPRESPWWLHVAVFVVCFTVLVVAVRAVHVIMERVSRAGGPQDPQDRYGGWVLAAVALLVLATAWAIQANRVAHEPPVRVETLVTCDWGRIDRCWAYWEYDGRTYGGRVPSSLGEGPRQIEISAAHPDVEITGQDTPIRRYSIWVVAPIALAGSAHWLLRSIALTRRLHRTVRGAGE